MSSSANHNHSTRARTWFLFFCSITAVGALGLGLVGGPPLTVEAYVVWRSSTTAAKTRGARRAAEPVASVVPVTGRERKQTREGTSAPRTAALSDNPCIMAVGWPLSNTALNCTRTNPLWSGDRQFEKK